MQEQATLENVRQVGRGTEQQRYREQGHSRWAGLQMEDVPIAAGHSLGRRRGKPSR